MAAFPPPAYLGEWRTAEHPDGYSKLYFSFEDVCAQCLIVRAVEGGMMICVPQGAVSSATLEAAAEAGHDGVLGPWKLVVVAPISVHGRELKRQLPGLLLDLAVAGLDLLSLEPRPSGSPVTFGTHRLQSIWPHPRRIVEALEDYLNGEDLEPHERLEPYLTAEDEEVDENGVPDGGFGGIATAAPGEDVLQQLLAATSSNAAVLGGLQTRLDSLDRFEERLLALEKQPPRPSTVPASGPAQGPAWAPQLFAEGETAQLEPGQVQQLLALAGRGPRTLGDVPGPSGLKPRNSPAPLGASAKPKPMAKLFDNLQAEDAEEAGDDGVTAGGDVLQQLPYFLSWRPQPKGARTHCRC